MQRLSSVLRHAAPVLLAGVLFFSSSARAAAPQNPVGRVEAVAGVAKVLHKGGKKPSVLLNGAGIFQDDAISTEDGARLHVVFADKTDIEMAGKGRLVVDKYVYDPAHPAQNKADIGIFGAAFSYVGGLIENHRGKPNVHVHLDFGSIGIRGTRFSRTMRHMQCWIYLEQGRITVGNRGGSVNLKPGQGTVMMSRDKPPHLRVWSPSEIAAIKADAAGRRDSLNK